MKSNHGKQLQRRSRNIEKLVKSDNAPFRVRTLGAHFTACGFMAIPITFQTKRIKCKIRHTEVQPVRDVEWIVWWYCGIYKNRQKYASRITAPGTC